MTELLKYYKEIDPNNKYLANIVIFGSITGIVHYFVNKLLRNSDEDSEESEEKSEENSEEKSEEKSEENSEEKSEEKIEEKTEEKIEDTNIKKILSENETSEIKDQLSNKKEELDHLYNQLLELKVVLDNIRNKI